MYNPENILRSWEVFNHEAFDLLRPIESLEQKERVVQFLDRLMDDMDSPEDSKYGVLWQLLSANLEKWEKVHSPIELSQPYEILQSLMEERGLKQTDLGHLIAQPNLSQILKGKKEISRKLAVSFAEYFKVPVALFIA